MRALRPKPGAEQFWSFPAYVSWIQLAFASYCQSAYMDDSGLSYWPLADLSLPAPLQISLWRASHPQPRLCHIQSKSSKCKLELTNDNTINTYMHNRLSQRSVRCFCRNFAWLVIMWGRGRPSFVYFASVSVVAIWSAPKVAAIGLSQLLQPSRGEPKEVQAPVLFSHWPRLLLAAQWLDASSSIVLWYCSRLLYDIVWPRA